MSLKNLNDEVYKRDKEVKSEFHYPTPPTDTLPQLSVTPTPSRWADQGPPGGTGITFTERHKHLLIWVICAVLILVSLLVFVGRRTFFFDPDKIQLTLNGPKTTETGKLVHFTVHYTNPNWVELPASDIVLSFPRSFQLTTSDGWDVHETQAKHSITPLPGRGSGQLEFTGSFQSFDQTAGLIRAFLRSGTQGTKEYVIKQSEWIVELEHSPIEIDISGPPAVTSGQSVEYVLDYHNDTDAPLDHLELAVEYPEGLTPNSFLPEPQRDEHIWTINTLKPGEHRTISIRGVVTGKTGDSRRLGAQIRETDASGNMITLIRREKVTQVIAPPLALSLMTDVENGIVKAGQLLQFHLNFRNEGSYGLRDLIAEVWLDPAYFDVTRLNIPKGATYTETTHQATFRASEVPNLRNLEPGQNGTVNFSVPVRKDLTQLGKQNLEFSVKATIDSPDLPHSVNTDASIAKSEVHFKVMTETSLAVNGYYYDNTFPNTGPIPPRVGEETTYTLHFLVRSDLNPLGDARMVLNFPTVVRFAGVVLGDRNAVAFNDRTGQLVWNMGTIPAGLATGKGLVIRVGLTPPLNTVGQVLNVLNDGQFTAHDTFTNIDVKIDVPSKTMIFEDDFRLSQTGPVAGN